MAAFTPKAAIIMVSQQLFLRTTQIPVYAYKLACICYSKLPDLRHMAHAKRGGGFSTTFIANAPLKSYPYISGFLA